MRIGLLIAAGLALVGFLVVAVVLPQMAGSDARDAAKALIAGAEAAQQRVEDSVQKNGGRLAGAGKGIKIPATNDPNHGELKWLVSEAGAIRGWNEKNALEVTFTPSLQGGKLNWNCRGYPVAAMPPRCGGR
jgi:hypothetical protein